MADVYASNWNEDDASNNSAAPDGAPEGMAPSGVNNWGRAVMGALKRLVNQHIPKVTAGTTTAYTLSYTVAPTALADGMTHLVQFNATCGASPTLNVNSLGAKPIHKYVAGAWGVCAAGDLTANMVARVTYNQTDGTYRLLRSIGTTPTPVENVGAANRTVVAADAGKFFRFDTVAAARTCTLPASASIYAGFHFETYDNGFYFGVALTPDAGDAIQGLPDGTVLTTIPNCRCKVMWDGVEWVVGGMGDPHLGFPLPYMGDTLKSGHVWANASTIGSASSGASTPHNSTYRLFVHLWTVNAIPIYDSAGVLTTRGASADADWTANKRMGTPDMRDHFVVGKATMGGAADPGIITAFDTAFLGATYNVSTHNHGGDTGLQSNTIGTNGGPATAAAAHDHDIGLDHHVPPAIVSNFVLRLY